MQCNNLADEIEEGLQHHNLSSVFRSVKAIQVTQSQWQVAVMSLSLVLMAICVNQTFYF